MKLKWLLVDANSGNECQLGQRVTTFRGESAQLIGWTPPQHEASTGRVLLKFENGFDQELYPSVIGAKFVDGGFV